MKFCPYSDCDSYAKRENQNEKNVTCIKNNHKFCFKCLKPWHDNKSCSDEIDKDFILWKKNKLIKQCPKCKIWIEKKEGWNNIICPQCHYQWCWLCKGIYNNNHYEIGGNCVGLQFENN